MVVIFLVAAAGLAAAGELNADNIVQLLTVALIVAAAVPVLRNKSKDSTIDALRSSADARMERIKDLEADLVGCKARADEEHERRREAERRVSKLEGQLEEQSKYTAPEAFQSIEKHLGQIEELLRFWIVKDETREIN